MVHWLHHNVSLQTNAVVRAGRCYHELPGILPGTLEQGVNSIGG